MQSMRRPAMRVVLWAGMMAAGIAALGGCQVLGFIAAGFEEREKARERDVPAEYTGLAGKTFAVVVAADRAIQGEHPGVVDELTVRITERLEAESGASGRIRAERLLRYLYDHPGWVALPRGELARRLGVDRLIVVELLEYQLHEPGNRYVWSGVAAGTVGVIEADSPLPDDYVYQKSIRVTYPDQEGYGQGDLTAMQVASVLIRRFTDRVSWLFYTHKETGKMEY